MELVDPSSGRPRPAVAEHAPAEVERRLARAASAFRDWRAESFAARASHLRSVAAALRAHRDRYARLMTLEMGKPIAQSEAEVEKCAWACDYYAENGAAFLAPERIATDASRSEVRCEPLGAVLAVMPWNFPFWQAIRAAAPALMAGNVVVLKHASNVPECALAIEEVFRTAGLPQGAFTTLLVSAARAESLVEHDTIAAVTLTGSEAAGTALAKRAGSVLKKIVLELGGSDPFVVLDDADPAEVAVQAAAARTINSGQSCIAAKRFIVAEAIADRFERAFADQVGALRVGDPMDRATQVGPLARPDLVGDLDRQVRESVARGARVLVGGTALDRPGCFYAPTVLAGVLPGMPTFDEETFGPVAPVIRAHDDDHAVELANRSRYGLGASVWTATASRGEAVAARIEAGQVFINGVVKSDPRLPFGGIKRSGHGRELSSAGIREFVNLKTIWIR